MTESLPAAEPLRSLVLLGQTGAAGQTGAVCDGDACLPAAADAAPVVPLRESGISQRESGKDSTNQE